MTSWTDLLLRGTKSQNSPAAAEVESDDLQSLKVPLLQSTRYPSALGFDSAMAGSAPPLFQLTDTPSCSVSLGQIQYSWLGLADDSPYRTSPLPTPSPTLLSHTPSTVSLSLSAAEFQLLRLQSQLGHWVDTSPRRSSGRE